MNIQSVLTLPTFSRI